MALGDPFVNIPSGTRPATFETDSENYHNVQLPTKIQEIAAAALAMSLNSVQSTSITSMLIGTGAKTLTTQINKGYLPGMNIRVVDVAAPTTNYVNALVTSYVVGTGVLQFTVPASNAFGAGTLSNWSIFFIAEGSATSLFVQQTIQNQSPNAFTTTGTSTAFIGTPSPAITANANNQRFKVTFNNAPTGTPTIAYSGQTPLNLKYRNPNGTLTIPTSVQVPAGWSSDVETQGTDAIIQSVAAHSGMLAQPVVGNLVGTVATGTTQIPADNTIPQVTEGDQYLSQTITPKNANNVLEVTVTVIVSHNSTSAGLSTALFKDGAANAIAAVVTNNGSINTLVSHTFVYRVVAGNTALTTFTVRCGGNVAGTTTFNGSAGGQLLGGVMASSITIKEYLP